MASGAELQLICKIRMVRTAQALTTFKQLQKRFPAAHFGMVLKTFLCPQVQFSGPKVQGLSASQLNFDAIIILFMTSKIEYDAESPWTFGKS